MSRISVLYKYYILQCLQTQVESLFNFISVDFKENLDNSVEN